MPTLGFTSIMQLYDAITQQYVAITDNPAKQYALASLLLHATLRQWALPYPRLSDNTTSF